MTSRSNQILSGITIGFTLLVGTLASGTASATGYNNRPITIYFTRHAEKKTTTVALGPPSTFYELDWGTDEFVATPLGFTDQESKGRNRDDACGEDKCAEELNALGLVRAELLADWFTRRGITRRLDAVYSSHKERTRQTVAPTAEAAGLTVIQLPNGPEFTELEPESTTPSECLTLDAIAAANPGDTLLIAGHSGTLYDIMGDGNLDGKDPIECSGLGLLSDGDATSERFPKDGKGKVADFGDIWKVTIRNGVARFNYRVNLQPNVLRIKNRAY